MGYSGWLQLVLTYKDTSCMDIYTETDFALSEAEALKILAENYPDIAEILTDKTGRITIIKQPGDSFELSTGGGKVKSVVDKRI